MIPFKNRQEISKFLSTINGPCGYLLFVSGKINLVGEISTDIGEWIYDRSLYAPKILWH